jgi:ATP-binding cassette, subfamily B (MDR/TAP), member 1
MFTLFYGFGLLVAAIAISFRWSWLLSLLALCPMVLLVTIWGINSPLYIKRQKASEAADSQAITIAAEVLGSIRTVVSLNAERGLLKKYSSAVDESKKHGLSLSWIIALQLAPTMSLTYAGLALVFWYALKQYIAGDYSSITAAVT